MTRPAQNELSRGVRLAVTFAGLAAALVAVAVFALTVHA